MCADNTSRVDEPGDDDRHIRVIIRAEIDEYVRAMNRALNRRPEQDPPCME